MQNARPQQLDSRQGDHAGRVTGAPTHAELARPIASARSNRHSASVHLEHRVDRFPISSDSSGFDLDFEQSKLVLDALDDRVAA